MVPRIRGGEAGMEAGQTICLLREGNTRRVENWRPPGVRRMAILAVADDR
jgi:hypothetical protein